MAFLYLAGGLIGLGTVVLGVDPEADSTLLAGLAAGALAISALLAALAERLPRNVMLPSIALGLALTTAAVFASGEADTPYALFYVWIGVAGWFVLEPRAAVAATLLTAALSGVVMHAVADRDPDTAAWWLTVVGSLLGMSAFAGVMHRRSRRLIDRLADAAVRDPLTGLLNRRGYQERLAVEIARARRNGSRLSIVLGDLDRFKALNDRFGHRRGDEALQAFAALCGREMRDVDLVSRVGGEEFAIVLPDADSEGAAMAAERLREAIHEELRAPDGSLLTASFGVATFPDHATDAEVLLDHADRALYVAKKAGRDRTAVFAGEQPTDGPVGAGS
jgi:diguanylate cyclase (GGDEF)-like protein